MNKKSNIQSSWEKFGDIKRFFVDVKDESGEVEGKAPVQIRKSCVVITLTAITGHSEKVAFFKTSRSKLYRDSRDNRRLTGEEVKNELSRLLDTSDEAEKAFQALQV